MASVIVASHRHHNGHHNGAWSPEAIEERVRKGKRASLLLEQVGGLTPRDQQELRALAELEEKEGLRQGGKGGAAGAGSAGPGPAGAAGGRAGGLGLHREPDERDYTWSEIFETLDDLGRKKTGCKTLFLCKLPNRRLERRERRERIVR